jgi:hypothetical protein
MMMIRFVVSSFDYCTPRRLVDPLSSSPSKMKVAVILIFKTPLWYASQLDDGLLALSNFDRNQLQNAQFSQWHEEIKDSKLVQKTP